SGRHASHRQNARWRRGGSDRATDHAVRVSGGDAGGFGGRGGGRCVGKGGSRAGRGVAGGGGDTPGGGGRGGAPPRGGGPGGLGRSPGRCCARAAGGDASAGRPGASDGGGRASGAARVLVLLRGQQRLLPVCHPVSLRMGCSSANPIGTALIGSGRTDRLAGPAGPDSSSVAPGGRLAAAAVRVARIRRADSHRPETRSA